MDRFQSMQVFAAVADGGSFIGAARTLGLSKPAVSRHVAELEGRLGVRLLHRTTRRLSLTPEGEAFQARCKALLADLEAAEAEVTHRADRAIGVLKVNCRRRSKFEPPCRPNIEPGVEASREPTGCG